MNQDPLLEKMDALLKRHRGSRDTEPTPAADAAQPAGEAPVAPPADAWLPVLTDVVVMGAVPAAAEAVPATLPQASLSVAEPSTSDVSVPAGPAPANPVVSDTLAEQLMGELEPKLATLLQDTIAGEIRSSLDDTVSALLAQLDVSIREIVRAAIEDKLGKR